MFERLFKPASLTEGELKDWGKGGQGSSSAQALKESGDDFVDFEVFAKHLGRCSCHALASGVHGALLWLENG